MDLIRFLEWLDSAPLGDAQRAINLGTRIVRDRTAQGPQPRRVAPAGRPRGGQPRDGSIRARAEAVLCATKAPQTAADLAAALSRGIDSPDDIIGTDSVRRILSRLAKDGQTFTRLDDGRFGLIEWGPPGSVADHDAASGVEG